MTAATPPRSWNAPRRELLAVTRATSLIIELGSELDARLSTEMRETERMRLLRATTNQITRAANDGVQAYVRATRAVAAEIARPHGDRRGAQRMRHELLAARAQLLTALNLAAGRYPPGEPGEPDRDFAPPPARKPGLQA
ncbi:MAG TPA: hypothetical protein VHK63_02200 [Candidatus Limnocylindria bacterium]|nr:hypothetical protein [Candidatus Limnocylindria bacterium]